MAEKAKVPSFTDLVVESWNLLKEKVGKIILIGIVGFLIQVVAFLVPVVLAIALFIGGSGLNFNHLTPEAFANIPITVKIGTPLLIVISYVVACILAIMVQVSGYLALDSKESSFGYYAKNSWAVVWPVFITMLLAGLIMFGSFFLFVIPAIFVAFFFVFTLPVVIFEKKSGAAALERSASLVQQNFGDVFVKLLIPFLIQAFVQFVFSSYNRGTPESALAMQLPLMVFSIFWSLFMFVYGFVLYKQVAKVSKNEKSGVLKWLAAVAIIGYLLLGGTVYAVVSYFKSSSGQKMIQELNTAIEENAAKAAEENAEMSFPDDSYVALPSPAASTAPLKQLPTKLPVKNLPR